MDCTYDSTTWGCEGGWYSDIWIYLQDNMLMESKNYPYTSGNGGYGETCNYKPDLAIGETLRGYFTVAPSTLGIKTALLGGPVSSAVSASSTTFLSYSSGIITTADCGTNVDHCVAIVGYGDTYYIVKNSWGTEWGESGYVRVGFGDGAGICGINLNVMYPYF